MGMTASTGIKRIVDELAAFWRDHGYQVVLAALVVVVLFMAVALLVSWKRGHVDRLVNAVAWFAGFGFSAEGMWIVTIQRAHITPVVAWAVFFVGEAFMGNSMLHARAAYLRTTVRDEGTGKVLKAGDPGKHGRAVWIIACAMAVIVGFASSNPIEFMLRASIPLGVALLWWNTLTAEGTERASSRFAWTPTRLLERVGALVPDENPDLKQMQRERRINAMTRAAHRLHDGGWMSNVAMVGHSARLRRLALAADDEMVAEVQRRVARVHRIVETTRPPANDLANEAANVATSALATVATGEPATKVAIAPPLAVASEVANAVAIRLATPPAKVATAKSPAVPATGLPASAREIAKARAKKPDMTQAQVVKTTGLSERTVQRYWGDTKPAEPAVPVNGHPVPDLIDAN